MASASEQLAELKRELAELAKQAEWLAGRAMEISDRLERVERSGGGKYRRNPSRVTSISFRNQVDHRKPLIGASGGEIKAGTLVYRESDGKLRPYPEDSDSTKCQDDC